MYVIIFIREVIFVTCIKGGYMLKLKNVSKFYYNKGVIATGFSRISIEFNQHEFVAIVGESGSGKSTLLNVISGLDSYEEGEMYINGEETSHYKESDFEEYRKKYVSNIFQNFNLVNSYTVYQNVELVMLLNGYKKKEVKEKVLELIDKVGLTKYKNTRCAKLSGGQKQRVAIARALARETPIIVCDEPTGNLDSKSAMGIVKLLKEISQDKLVIIVTHNLEQVEEYVSRIVRMHDGKIVSDKKIREVEKEEKTEIPRGKRIGLGNIIRLGIRNTFNIVPKFVLLFIVFLLITSSLLTVYGSLKKSEYEEGKSGNNYYFSDLSDTRVIIKKKDKSSINTEEFDNIRKINHLKHIVKNDILMDTNVWFQNENGDFYLNGNLNDIDMLDRELAYGRMPEEDNEVVYLTNNYNYLFNERRKDAIKQEYFYEGDKDGIKIKIVGIAYLNDNEYTSKIYGKEKLLLQYMGLVDREYSNIIVNINEKNHKSYNYVGDNFTIKPSSYVSKGCSYVSEDINYTCKDYNCKNKSMNINVDNLYYNDSLNLKICEVYNKKNVDRLLGIDKDGNKYGYIYINIDEYNNLFIKDSYQASIYVDDVDNIELVVNELDKLGYNTLEIRNTLNKDGADLVRIFKIIKLVVIIMLIVTLFFISYFVIRLILKSRNIYYSTVRILGGNKREVKRITDVELLFDATIAYISYISIMLLVKYDVINIRMISNTLKYLKIRDYILMYLILIIMSYLISTRFSMKLFKKSAMNSYREEI